MVNERYIVFILTQLGIVQVFITLRIILRIIPLENITILLCILILVILSMFFKELTTTGSFLLSKLNKRLLVCYFLISCSILIFSMYEVDILVLIYFFLINSPLEMSMLPMPHQEAMAQAAHQAAIQGVFNRLNNISNVLHEDGVQIRLKVRAFEDDFNAMNLNRNPATILAAKNSRGTLQIVAIRINSNLEHKRDLYD